MVTETLKLLIRCIVIINVVMAAQKKLEDKGTRRQKGVIHPVCWKNKFICTHFTGPVNKWFGIAGCKGWCNCQGLEVGYCIREYKGKTCAFENWKCHCYGPPTKQTC